ncbi:flagellar basal body rod protein FlgB [Alicyclobacillus shizuokensis]|uniref:flagellar basal body rod protein FlgB n=1 Tax=Alicyclobacillus shizuokensis TaxID=392014 RepID=UPI000833D9A8|nr:flagellar basal body rod protein FlgB [Alicyclobacillus shizuokensis]MCL6626445.1 flagellar basal body rod protein FlgB [Alicyclobacillus shizuokensis]
MTLDTGTFQLLQNALAASDLRQSVYANNIANVDTPGYKRQDVSFESMLQQQLASTDGSGLTTDELNQLVSVQPQLVTDTSTEVQNNGNNVDVDAEMSELAANQIRYNALVQDVDLRILRLREAIQGG